MKAKRIHLLLAPLLIGSILVCALFVLLATQKSSAWAEAPFSPSELVRYVSISGNDADNICTNPSSPCRTVQHAVAVAQDGDEIRVAAGTYTGRMTTYIPAWSQSITATVVLTKNIASILGGYGADFQTRDLDANVSTLSAAAFPEDLVVVISGTNTVLDGFSITGSHRDANEMGAGVFIVGGSPTISHNRIYANRAKRGAGIWVSDGSSPTILSNEIYSNTAYEAAGGIQVIASGGTIQDNRIYSNTAESWAGGGMEIAVNATTAVHDNAIEGNAASAGGGIAVNWYCTATLSSNTIRANTATGWAGGGVLINDYSNAQLNGNLVTQNEAFDFGGGVAIYNQSDASLSDNDIISNNSQNGGGIGAALTSAAEIKNNRIYSNTATSNGGGGIGMLGGGSTARIEDNQIGYNTTNGRGGGLLIADTGSATIRHNEVFSNTTHHQGTIVVVDSPNGVVLLDSNGVHDNHVTGEDYETGGIQVENMGQPVTLTNNVVFHNQNRGIKIANANSALFNNTVVGNGPIGVELFTWPPDQTVPFTATLVNNIVEGHSECGVNAWTSAQHTIIDYNDVWSNTADYCDATSSPMGVHNISADPQFVNPAAGDYHIRLGSPAMNTGTNTGAPTYDKDGLHRPQGSAIDMGAYEVRIRQNYLPLTLRQ